MINSIIICDLDGTLIDSREDLATGVNLMRAEYSLPPLDLPTVADYVGNGARKLAERALQGTDIDIDEATKLMKYFYMDHMLDKTRLYPSVKEGLQILADKGFKLAVVTNKPQEPCVTILEYLGVAADFDMILGGNSKYRLKPDPEMLFEVMKQTNSAPGNSWIVGDNYTDLESGRHAGIKRCFARYGFGYQQKEKFDIAVDQFSEFAKAVNYCSEK